MNLVGKRFAVESNGIWLAGGSYLVNDLISSLLLIVVATSGRSSAEVISIALLLQPNKKIVTTKIPMGKDLKIELYIKYS